MTQNQRIEAFAALGEKLKTLVKQPSEEFTQILRKAEGQNPWFTRENSVKMLANIAQMLNAEELKHWIENYNYPEKTPKKIAVIMAGNIPMVGFHDALCVLITGNELVAKLSSKDAVLLPFVFKLLVEIAPEFADFIRIEGGVLKNFDAIIATGSNNSARYFDYYFGKYPHIIRKNRNSVAVLNGNESKEQLQLLGNDIFDYFGLGCRSIAKLYVPINYNFPQLFETWEHFGNIATHNKYMNNYEYNKSILLVAGTPHFDTGYALFTENSAYNSAIAVNHYEYYENKEQLTQILQRDNDLLQCVASEFNIEGISSIAFGSVQENNLSDYADGIDVIEFLKRL